MKNLTSESPFISSLSILVSSYAVILLSLLTSIVVNRSLGPEIKGVYTSLRLLPSFFMPLFMFGYPGGILYYSLRKRIDISKFFMTGFVTLLSLGFLMFFLIYLLSYQGVFGRIISESERTALLVICATSPLVFLNAYMEKVLFSMKLFRPSNIRNSLTALFLLVFLSLAWGLNLINIQVAIYVTFASILFNFVLNVIYIFRIIDIDKQIYFDQFFLPWNYGSRSFINQLISKSNDKFDRILLGFIMRPLDFGLYTTGVALCGMVAKIPGSYTKVFFTQIANKTDDEAVALLHKAVRLTIFISLVLAIILAGLAKLAITSMYGIEYLGATTVVYFYIPGLVFQISAKLPIKFYAARGKPLKNSIIYVSALLVSSPFYFILIPRYGINGAAISASLAYIAAFSISMFQIRRDYYLNLHDALIPRLSDFTSIGKSAVKLIKKK